MRYYLAVVVEGEGEVVVVFPVSDMARNSCRDWSRGLIRFWNIEFASRKGHCGGGMEGCKGVFIRAEGLICIADYS